MNDQQLIHIHTWPTDTKAHTSLVFTKIKNDRTMKTSVGEENF